MLQFVDVFKEVNKKKMEGMLDDEPEEPSELVMEWLEGFHLSHDALYELKVVLERRQLKDISTAMSSEAKLVIHQLKEENQSQIHKNRPRQEADVKHHAPKHRKSIQKAPKSGKTKRFAETFTKNLSFRLDGDITEPSRSEEDVTKRSLTGDHIEVTMETVEIVDSEAPPKEDDTDEIAIDEMAKLNSIDKCVVWMEVNDSDGDSRVTKKEHEVT
ncbi:uncharacterized protein LOC128193078 [Crassostrea angulata]|uniref:uncharacterized protein LOC128193078 n=1 Tax=Magallana angulata TaxID=2784310 RepID=UPI0022B0A1A8|nr:uncharacterized protein LOC128193078 [Crassostrea angulata]XP_052722275.1 uncharacterized protein LOC128193078 [Crassostrea angulata]XP_052722276.1 uncharacterized protein LOC128193078 [Crassostrea angulata]XP_052722277.1 uncharacterized protein LOC128193078 [Crassostrea angulata]